MKLSTILFTAAFLLFFGILTAYNFSLKAAYLTGNYKKRFSDHHFTPLNKVSEMQIKSANLLDIVVEYGKQEGIWVRNRIKDDIKIHQDGETLLIDLINNKEIRDFSNSSNEIVVVLSHLSQLRTYYREMNDKEIEGRIGTVYLKNLKEKGLDVILSDQSGMSMDSCEVNSFRATIGGNGANSTLQIVPSNRIDTATFDIRGGNFLELNNSGIKKIYYKLSDSSKVYMVGKTIKTLQAPL
ncbi:hypothetical protein [Pedobacter frigoris]|uniref:hypothetical protein n=1 Tax=Pedobacter frigoris TaxID=2571272 RepID=UPI0029313C99|nr:hypothetical protein [Pedobacter frigoris]